MPSSRKASQQSNPTRRAEKKRSYLESTNVVSPPSSNFESFFSAVSILIIFLNLNLSRLACQLALHPLFGSIASNHNFDFLVRWIDLLIVPLINFLFPNLVPNLISSNLLSAFLVWRAPDTFGRVISSYSSRFGVRRGPLVFQSLAYWPIRFCGVSAVQAVATKLICPQAKRVDHSAQIQKIATSFLLPLLLHGVSSLMLPMAHLILNYVPACQIFDVAAGFSLGAVLLASIAKKLASNQPRDIRKVNVVIILGCIILAVFLPFPKPLCHEPDDFQVKSTDQVKYRPLARKLSSTGLVLVGELTLQPGSQFRFMRCDHSLLGGVWIGPAKQDILKRSAQAPDALTKDELDLQAARQADPIYATFILQTAARLAVRSGRNVTESKESPKALILGLGAGTSGRLLMKHDVIVAILEIDPIVYEYAQKYFGLPTPTGGIFLEDGRAYLASNENKKHEYFDYIIHDIFTGGSVASTLFTLESWQAIRAKLKEDGILVVNFVGRPSSEATLIVLTTLFKIFPFCRAFSEYSDQVLGDSDYQNMVIFCSPGGKPKFGKPSELDISRSSQFEIEILNSFEDLEIDLQTIQATRDRRKDDLILTDKNHEKLDLAQIEDGLHHWNIMRSGLPDIVWENYY